MTAVIPQIGPGLASRKASTSPRASPAGETSPPDFEAVLKHHRRQPAKESAPATREKTGAEPPAETQPAVSKTPANPECDSLAGCAAATAAAPLEPAPGQGAQPADSPTPLALTAPAESISPPAAPALAGGPPAAVGLPAPGPDGSALPAQGGAAQPGSPPGELLTAAQEPAQPPAAQMAPAPTLQAPGSNIQAKGAPEAAPSLENGADAGKLSSTLTAPEQPERPAAPAAAAAAPSAPSALTAIKGAVAQAGQSEPSAADNPSPVAQPSVEPYQAAYKPKTSEARSSLPEMPESALAGVGKTGSPPANTPLPEPARLAEAHAAEIVRQINRQIDQMSRTGRASLRMQLYPEELGRIELRLTAGPEGLGVTLIADQAPTGRLIESQLNNLRQSLMQAGFQLANLDVGHEGSPNQGQWRDALAENQGARTPAQPAAAAPESLPGGRSFASGGRVDYRI